MFPSNACAWASRSSSAIGPNAASWLRSRSIHSFTQLNAKPCALRVPSIHPYAAQSLQHASYSTERNGVPFRVAVIGSGPAGFYSARRLLSRIPSASIDMYEQLPVPFGLVRFGVAPDHPEVKNCIDTFNEVAALPNFRFYGNVSVGKDIALPELREAYDALLFAYGAAKDRTLGIPGEDGEKGLRGIYSARAFVGWYNGLPEYENLNPDLSAGDTAVVIGQGNVALDVARVLLSDVDRLKSTDIAGNALEVLSKSKVRRVHVVGRRGPMQMAATIKELRELMQLTDVRFEPLADGIMPADTKILPRAKRRIAELMIKYSEQNRMSASEKGKSWSLDFMRSPAAFLSSPDDPHQLSSVLFDHTKYADEARSSYNPSASVSSTEEESRMDASLAFRSIGYKSIAIPGMEDLGISFDSRRGIVPNIAGRVITSTGEHIDGLYCTGWVKNGPTGVIATTMEDAFGAAETMVQDWNTGAIRHISGRDGFQRLKDKLSDKAVSWEDWLKIDAEEKRLGAAHGKEREKIRSVKDMLRVVR